jgi:hypothetical protein
VTIAGENRTLTNNAVETVTRTVTNQIQVAGVSSELPSHPASTSPIQVLGESASIAPAPSAGARTGQGLGILPYLLFGGGVVLMLTSLRVRRRNAH